MKAAARRSVSQEFELLSSAYTRLALARAQREIRQIVAWAEPQPEERVLDAACGPARLGHAFAPHVAQVNALDLCPQMLKKARELTASSHPPLLLTVGDLERLPYRSRSFHLLACAHVFANLQRPLRVMREFARVIRRDGRIVVIEVVAPENPAQRGWLNRLEAGRGHVYTRVRSHSQFANLFTRAGLRVVATRSRLHLCRFHEWVRLSPAAIDHPEHAHRLRRTLLESVDGDKAGLHPHPVRGEIVFYHRVMWSMLRLG
jgi:ubiquinone/menaquinone biosynthesis C-methylase UbiE